MFHDNSVQDTRQVFFTSWQKHALNQPLLPLEQQVVEVILDHPEYHHFIDNPTQIEQTFFPELGQTNPFLHMGLHLAIREQVATDRPIGIASIYQQLQTKFSDHLRVEHLIMECLAEELWQAQRNQSMPNEQTYLNACRQLLQNEPSIPFLP